MKPYNSAIKHSTTAIGIVIEGTAAYPHFMASAELNEAPAFILESGDDFYDEISQALINNAVGYANGIAYVLVAQQQHKPIVEMGTNYEVKPDLEGRTCGLGLVNPTINDLEVRPNPNHYCDPADLRDWFKAELYRVQALVMIKQCNNHKHSDSLLNSITALETAVSSLAGRMTTLENKF